MTQLTIFSRLAVRTPINFRQTLSEHSSALSVPKFHYYSTAPKPPLTWSEAKPFKECPRATRWEFLRGFLPGGKFYNKDLTEIIQVLYAEKGDIVFMPGAFGKKDMLMTQNPDDMERLFRHEGVWPERVGFEMSEYHRQVYRKDYFGRLSGLLTTQGKDWGELRTAVNPIIVHPKNVKSYLPTMSKVNQEFIERIKKIRDPKTFEVPANFKDEINRWTLESVSVVALDKQLGLFSDDNADGKRLFDNLQRFFDLSVDLEVKPSLWRYLPNRKFKECLAIMDDIIQISEKYVNEAMERIEKMPAKPSYAEQSVLEKLLKIDKKIATVMAMDMIAAGIDTTTSTFTGLLLCLAKNPEKQQKLREEILTLLPRKDSPLTVENMTNLPYLRACLKESLRIYPLIVGNMRVTQEDLVLSGYQVPKGSHVSMININLLNDPQHFSRPQEFLPERWLRRTERKTEIGAEGCPQSAATKSSHPFIYLPFGFGPRSCIGRRIAEMELEIGTSRIIRNFEVEFNHPTKNAFKALQINVPAIPLKFKFSDLPD